MEPCPMRQPAPMRVVPRSRTLGSRMVSAPHQHALVAVEALRILDHHPGLHELLADAAGERPGRERELLLVVHPCRLHRRDPRGDRARSLGRERDQIGQVELALRVLRIDARERLPEESGVGAVQARVHLADLPLLGGGVLLLHDEGGAALRRVHDAPVAGWVFERHGSEGECGAAAPLHDRAERLRGEEGRVTGEDEHLTVEAAQPGPCREHRVRRPELLLLHGEAERRVRQMPAEGRLHLLGLVADHHHHRIGPRLERALHGVIRQRPSADLVQHLGPAGLHARALAGGEDDGGERRTATGGGHKCEDARRGQGEGQG